MGRKPFIGGNFKSNGTVDFLTSLINSFNELKTCSSDVYVFPSFIHIPLVQSLLMSGGGVMKVGSQNVSSTGNGAYTGEVNCEMLRDMKVDCTLVGHSERRQYYNETDQVVNKKVIRSLESQIKVVLCIGESLQERESGLTNEVIKRQLTEDLKNVCDLSNVVIAYEPIWAIGTGVVATPEQAQEAHSFIRDCISNMYNKNTAEDVRIIYGGSVTPDNCKIMISCKDIDGFLVGGASLKPSFIEIVNSTII
ncbi:triose-phosphate isomerase [Cryptosporidium ryanae]|uniref:triose-phosphate isomerase n=1 Tax=Cryptosporidium ryanae TaxID=515981 RepID=UPI00351A96CF|nr:triose-phosphate isomerase [Cryptosporidium ryanae]